MHIRSVIASGDQSNLPDSHEGLAVSGTRRSRRSRVAVNRSSASLVGQRPGVASEEGVAVSDPLKVVEPVEEPIGCSRAFHDPDAGKSWVLRGPELVGFGSHSVDKAVGIGWCLDEGSGKQRRQIIDVESSARLQFVEIWDIEAYGPVEGQKSTHTLETSLMIASAAPSS